MSNPETSDLNPITLDALQGDWLSGNGTHITIKNRDVYMNKNWLRFHQVEVFADSSDGGNREIVRGIGNLKQIEGYEEATSTIFLRGGPQSMDESQFQFAPREVWTRVESEEARLEKLKTLGYAGRMAQFEAGESGVHGCIPGTLCQWMPSTESTNLTEKKSDEEKNKFLKDLIMEWCEDQSPSAKSSGLLSTNSNVVKLCKVPSSKVVPDISNRDETGLGVELVHYIAISMQENGFKKRTNDSDEGHDIPVLVREPPGTNSHREALESWKTRVAAEEANAFPPVTIKNDGEMFCTLGNGHFLQALNLYCCRCPIMLTNKKQYEGKYYEVGAQNDDLRNAIQHGVPSIVLKSDTPADVRSKIAVLLNSQAEFRWTVLTQTAEDNGDAGVVDLSKVVEKTRWKYFDRMTKHIPGEGKQPNLPCYKFG